MCNTYVLASYVHRRDSEKTYASCWLAHVTVGSLVLHEAGGYIPPLPGPQTGRYIMKIVAGGNQGNRTRNRQVLSEIYRVGVGHKEARECKIVETERTMQWNGPCNGTEQTVERNETDRFMPFLVKRCRRAMQTDRTVFRSFFGRAP